MRQNRGELSSARVIPEAMAAVAISGQAWPLNECDTMYPNRYSGGIGPLIGYSKGRRVLNIDPIDRSWDPS